MIRDQPVDLMSSPVDLMSSAATAVRAFNERTRPAQLPDGCVAPADAYRIITSAGELAHDLPRALAQIAGALRCFVGSHHPDDRDAESLKSVAMASRSLHSAGRACNVAVQHLADALSAIANP